MAGSLIGRIRRWFHPEPPVSGSFDPAKFERICLENPKAAHAALAADQRDLADELKRTYGIYTERLVDLMSRLKELPPSEIRREAKTLQSAQEQIRMMLRRIEASARTARQLEHELGQWEARAGERGPRHADHPDVRAEIVRSELAARGLAPVRKAAPNIPEPVVPQEPQATVVVAVTQSVSTREVEPDTARMDVPLDPMRIEHLLEAIKSAKRESERWHAIPEPDHDAVEQVRQLRMWHAQLRKMDREQGIHRDRLELAPRMRGY